MEIKTEFPPNYEAIVQKFDIKNRDGIVFAYGNILYNPSGNRIPEHLMVHEQTHEKQQAEFPEGIDGWWSKYLVDDTFRLSQEVEAYSNQYKFICAGGASRQAKRLFVRAIAKDLSSPIYGRMIGVEKAEELIKGH